MKHLKLFESYNESTLVYIELSYRKLGGQLNDYGRKEEVWERIGAGEGIIDLKDPANLLSYDPSDHKFPEALSYIIKALENSFDDPPYTLDNLFDKRVSGLTQERTTGVRFSTWGGASDIHKIEKKDKKDLVILTRTNENDIIRRSFTPYHIKFVYPRLSQEGKKHTKEIMIRDYHQFSDEMKRAVENILGIDAETFNSIKDIKGMGLI